MLWTGAELSIYLFSLFEYSGGMATELNILGYGTSHVIFVGNWKIMCMWF